MGKVIPFRPKSTHGNYTVSGVSLKSFDQSADKVRDGDEDFTARMQRIKESLEKINHLMTQLRERSRRHEDER